LRDFPDPDIENKWVLSEGFPPTVNHQSIGHCDGAAIDIKLLDRSDPQFKQRLKKLCLAAKAVGFVVLNEYGVNDREVTSACGVSVYNRGHLHLKEK